MASKALEFVTDAVNQISPVPVRSSTIVTAAGVTAATYLASKIFLSPSANVSSNGPYDDAHPDTKSVYDLRATRYGTAYATTRRDVDAKIRYAKTGIASKEMTPAITLPTLLDQACASAGDAPALRTERPTPARPAKKGDPAPKSLPVDQWKTWSYNEYLAEIKVAARAFMSFGLKKHDAVTIYGFNAPEWHMAELSAIYCGGIAAGIYPSDTAEQVTFKANHSGSVVAVCESVKQLKVFIESKRDGRLPKLKAVVVWTDDSWGVGKQVIPDDTAGLNVVFWKDLGKYAASVSESKLQARTKSISPGNVCAYIYTSGTTGSPKAVMITHDNIVYEAKVAVHLLPQMGATPECVLSYLPLSHVAGMMVDIVCPVVMTACRSSHCTVYFARSYDLKLATIGDRLRAVRPSMFLGVPRVWEKISEKMKSMVAKNPLTGVKLKLALWAKKLGLEHQMNCQLGGSGSKGFGYPIAKKLILDTVKRKLGLDRCKFAFTGAAPITTETLSYFGALGIQINEVYGMSECCGATTWSTDEAHVWGSCGFCMPGMEVKVFKVDDRDLNKKTECPRAKDMTKASEEEQGEICFRGRHIMAGYMANPDLGKDHVKYVAVIARLSRDCSLKNHNKKKQIHRRQSYQRDRCRRMASLG